MLSPDSGWTTSSQHIRVPSRQRMLPWPGHLSKSRQRREMCRRNAEAAQLFADLAVQLREVIREKQAPTQNNTGYLVACADHDGRRKRLRHGNSRNLIAPEPGYGCGKTSSKPRLMFEEHPSIVTGTGLSCLGPCPPWKSHACAKWKPCRRTRLAGCEGKT